MLQQRRLARRAHVPQEPCRAVGQLAERPLDVHLRPRIVELPGRKLTEHHVRPLGLAQHAVADGRRAARDQWQFAWVAVVHVRRRDADQRRTDAERLEVCRNVLGLLRCDLERKKSVGFVRIQSDGQEVPSRFEPPV